MMSQHITLTTIPLRQAYLLSKIGFSFVRQSTHKTRIMTLNLFSEDVQRSMFNEKILTVYREYGERNGKCHAI